MLTLLKKGISQRNFARSLGERGLFWGTTSLKAQNLFLMFWRKSFSSFGSTFFTTFAIFLCNPASFVPECWVRSSYCLWPVIPFSLAADKPWSWGFCLALWSDMLHWWQRKHCLLVGAPGFFTPTSIVIWGAAVTRLLVLSQSSFSSWSAGARLLPWT